MAARRLIHERITAPVEDLVAMAAAVPAGCDPIYTYMVDLLATNRLFVVIPKSLPLAERQIKHGQVTHRSPHGTIMVDGYMLDMFDSEVFYALVGLCRRNGDNTVLELTMAKLCRAMGKKRSAPLYNRIADSLYKMSKTGCSVWNNKGMPVMSSPSYNVLWGYMIKGGKLYVQMNPWYVTDYTGHYLTVNNHLRRKLKGQYSMALMDFFRDQEQFYRQRKRVRWQVRHLVEACRGYYGEEVKGAWRYQLRSFKDSVAELVAAGFFTKDSEVVAEKGEHWLYCRRAAERKAVKPKAPQVAPQATTTAQLLHSLWVEAGLPFTGSGGEWGILNRAGDDLEALYKKLEHGPRYRLAQLARHAIEYAAEQAQGKSKTPTVGWLNRMFFDVQLPQWLEEYKGIERAGGRPFVRRPGGPIR